MEQLKRIENELESTNEEISWIDISVQRLGEIADKLPCRSVASSEIERFRDKLAKERGFLVQIKGEDEQSIEQIRNR